jgi:hypothetical protein
MTRLPLRDQPRAGWKDNHGGQDQGYRGSGPESAAGATPVQAWRAWSDCGDGGRVHLILDRQAQQLWLLPSDETLIDPRSMG